MGRGATERCKEKDQANATVHVVASSCKFQSPFLYYLSPQLVAVRNSGPVNQRLQASCQKCVGHQVLGPEALESTCPTLSLPIFSCLNANDCATTSQRQESRRLRNGYRKSTTLWEAFQVLPARKSRYLDVWQPCNVDGMSLLEKEMNLDDSTGKRHGRM